MVQMPGDVPVATVGVGSGGARNAGLLAVQMLALADPALQENRGLQARLVEKAWQGSGVAGNVKDMKKTETLHWVGGIDGHLRMIDQTLLPVELVEIDAATWKQFGRRSRRCGSAARRPSGSRRPTASALGCKLAAGQDETAFFGRLEEVTVYLATSRPTAVNLFWALDRMKAAADKLRGRPSAEIAACLLDEARAIHEEDRAMCRAIGQHGAKLLADGQGVLTHCNAGGLATAEYGTALAVFFSAAEQGKRLQVYADETRPLLQGGPAHRMGAAQCRAWT